MVVGAGRTGIARAFPHSRGRVESRERIDMFVSVARRTLY